MVWRWWQWRRETHSFALFPNLLSKALWDGFCQLQEDAGRGDFELPRKLKAWEEKRQIERNRPDRCEDRRGNGKKWPRMMRIKVRALMNFWRVFKSAWNLSLASSPTAGVFRAKNSNIFEIVQPFNWGSSECGPRAPWLSEPKSCSSLGSSGTL